MGEALRTGYEHEYVGATCHSDIFCRRYERIERRTPSAAIEKTGAGKDLVFATDCTQMLQGGLRT